ncbi:hypothetical protein WJX73_000370 [Symbiochloris irregularis]|uniref:Deacetylase sirtuin-type domain-containing protein n=1 Tax=Symbiochloris irregularis TaxID=706552 RepID=A0AAW1P0A2_9CHLO
MLLSLRHHLRGGLLERLLPGQHSKSSVRGFHQCSAARSSGFSQDRVLADGTFVPAGTVTLTDGSLGVPPGVKIRPPGSPPTPTKRTLEASEKETAAEEAGRPSVSVEQGLDLDSQPSTSGRAQARSSVPLTAPLTDPISSYQLQQLVDFMQSHRRIAVLTGAGCSTESNIPDYRGRNGAYSTGFKPMTHQQFTSSEHSRSRYWARSFAGWHEYCDVKPNPAHFALARLQSHGRISHLMTQNVDRLHQKAGARDVLELHGTTHEVICLQCQQITDRYEFQEILAEANPDAAAAVRQMKKRGIDHAGAAERMNKIGSDERGQASAKAGAAVRRPDGDVEWPVRRPDGDVELRDAGHGFYVPPCTACGGPLKPDVVFFGDGVPAWRSQRALEISGELCDAMLVVGSSMQVYSAYRLARACTKRDAPLAIVNVGTTRADNEASLKIECLVGEVLSRLAAEPAMLVPPG